jgi:hypothetical protein
VDTPSISTDTSDDEEYHLGTWGDDHAELHDTNLVDGHRDRRPPDRYGYTMINALYAKSLRMEEGEGDEAFGHAFSVLYDADGVPYPRSQTEAAKRHDAAQWADADRLELESMR